MYGSTVFDQSTVSGKLSRAGTAIVSHLSRRVRVKLELIRLSVNKKQSLYKRRDVLEVQKLLQKSNPPGDYWQVGAVLRGVSGMRVIMGSSGRPSRNAQTVQAPAELSQ